MNHSIGDVGAAYIHNPDWDLTPFQLYKLKQQKKVFHHFTLNL